MSMTFTANQFDQSYRASRLGNWEVPAATRAKKPVDRGPGATTTIIVDSKGHLLPGQQKRAPSTTTEQAYRWPEKNARSQDRFGGAATMGYKGIETAFLPLSSVYVKTVPGTREYPYGQPI